MKIASGEQTITLEAGDELVLTSGVKKCTVMIAIIEGEIDAEKGSELLRLRDELVQLKAAFGMRQ